MEQDLIPETISHQESNIVAKKKRGISHRYHNLKSLSQLNDTAEIKRLITNLRWSISNAKEENKEPLRAKLRVLLEVKAELIRDGKWEA